MSRRPRTLPSVLVLGLAAVLAALAVRSQVRDVPPWLLPVDDAYIFMRYAQQAAHGMPFQWNAGEPSTGATDPVFTLLLVPGQAFFGDLVGWSKWSSFVGLLSLAGLGLAAASLMRALLAPDTPGGSSTRAWPLAAGLAVIGGGPFAYFSLGGMDNAFASAMLLGALARVVSSDGQKGLVWIALLPWVRPDYAVVVGVTALWLLVCPKQPPPAWPRRLVTSTLLFVPGLALIGINLALTGHASPGGALAKSVFSDPFQTPSAALAAVARQLTENLVPVYLGLKPTILPPPVGLLAVAAVVWVLVGVRRGATEEADGETDGNPGSEMGSDTDSDTDRVTAHRMLLPVLVWLALALVATTSGYLWWQRLRHHHPGLALAWVFALVVLASWFGRRSGGAPRGLRPIIVLCLGLLPWIGLVEASKDYAASTRSFYAHGFRTAAWLQDYLSRSDPKPVVAMHDAGLLSLVAAPLEGDVAQVDLMGLGTTDLALPYRDGIGAVVEHLARRATLPTLAVGRKALLRLGPLLGPELFSSAPGAPEATVVAPIDTSRLRGTALSAPGVDFGYLPSEARVGLRWDPLPPTSAASLGAIVAESGVVTVHGCRPLQGSLGVDLRGLEDDGSRLVVTFTAVQEGGTGPESAAVLRGTVEGQVATAEATRSVPGRLELPAASTVDLQRIDGSGDVPCLESIAVVD